MSNFFNQKVLAILKVKNRQVTFSKPAPEASPVLTLGITSKGQVRTSVVVVVVIVVVIVVAVDPRNLLLKLG